MRDIIMVQYFNEAKDSPRKAQDEDQDLGLEVCNYNMYA